MVHHFLVLLLLSYDRLSRKPILFKSFTGLSVQEFDEIYDKEITKRYHDYELQRLSKKRIGSEILVQQEDLSNWMLKIDV